jgi:F0F1-type ATP synthase assembly protein I
VKLLPRTAVTADSNVGRGIEFALGTALFLGIGYALDRWLGTQPVFIIGFFLLGVIGQSAAMYYRYNEAMTAHDAQRAAGQQSHHQHGYHQPRTHADSSGVGGA